MQKLGFFWHVHHKILLEWCHGYDERVAYIRTHKSSREQELRLRLFQPVKGQLPQEVVEAGNAYGEALKADSERRNAWFETGNAYGEALKAYDEVRNTWFGLLKKSYRETRKAYNEARNAYDEAGNAYDEALKAFFGIQNAYNEALANHKDAIEALHKDECRPDCPWDGETIFPAA